MILDVRYRVKVYVRVDTDTREVLAVYENDEAIELDFAEDEGLRHHPQGIISHPDGKPFAISDYMARKAIRIAELDPKVSESDMWPAWERGW